MNNRQNAYGFICDNATQSPMQLLTLHHLNLTAIM